MVIGKKIAHNNYYVLFFGEGRNCSFIYVNQDINGYSVTEGITYAHEGAAIPNCG